MRQPNAYPGSTPSPVPVPVSTPTPSPIPAAKAATTPLLDPIAWLSQHEAYWPKEVRLLEPVVFWLRVNGAEAGSVEVPTGRIVELTEIRDGKALLSFEGGTAWAAIAKTNLGELSKSLMMKGEANIATPVPSATTMPSPARSSVAGYRPADNLVPLTLKDEVRAEERLANRRITLSGTADLRISGTGNPLARSMINFTSPDARLILEKVGASEAENSILPQLLIQDTPAATGSNVRIAGYGHGTVIIPQGPNFEAMAIFDGNSLSGASMSLRCYVKYDIDKLGAMKAAIRSFRLKRGYMATVAQNEDGTGFSKNYVAQDRDVVVNELPAGLAGNVAFVRIFPWRWTAKKGVAGGIWQGLNVGWYYNWNISDNSTPELEYVPIAQKLYWPGLDQDWQARGATHLLGYNEPDHKDQANLTVDQAIQGWPKLLATGLRLGSPAVSDGGLNWLYDFIAKADGNHLRVDFIAVHYYRSHNPADAKGAATQFYNFLKEIHGRTKRPIWVTEWNNGANWTHDPKPTFAQQKEALKEMIKMLDRTPFVERYAIYNWVEETRSVKRKDGTLTPAGEVYRDQESPLAYDQSGP